MRKIISLSILLALVACGGDKAPETANGKPAESKGVDPDSVRAAQKRYADSVLNLATPLRDQVKKLGEDKYDVGSTRLRDSVAARVAESGCIAKGREANPYLSGTVTIWVNMGVVGSDVIRVNDSKWTAPVGQIVDDCINEAAKKWKFDSSYGRPKAYLVQVQIKADG